ncbi:peptidylprolyl isomerase [Runella salmonicolor]|uniref:Peptidyl-prolyl cis-trans isomerase n=1 Tax=Runella salmonicolor TaxID=2950278 RepID=A0ABT1FGT3_9BACT|nr:peptidylprolyl isomerase [Runella salmonicolor]MCP1380963.1 peptidylprolyl isomerase [Runella salmonicolor]
MLKTLSLLALSIVLVSSVYKEKTYTVGQIKTPKGEILFQLYDETPNHKASFIKLANQHYWDTLTFNRVINNFVAQGGCPDTPAGFSDSPYLLKPEFRKEIRHIYGAVGAGRDNNPEMLSAGCQFYIVQNKNGLARLDDKFTVFGQVFKGMDVVDAITAVKTDSLDAPLSPISLKVSVIQLTAKELKEKGFAGKIE